MRFKIGGRDPRFRGISGRNMSELSRLVQLFVSLQILFGSRRGGGIPFLLPLLFLGALCLGGWFFFQVMYSPERMLEQAHANWDSGVTGQKMDAIIEYRKLLQKSDPLEPGTKWLKTDRDMLYRRIIEYELVYEQNKTSAYDWVVRAWDEGIRDLRFPPGEVLEFWKDSTDLLRLRNRSRSNRGAEPNPTPNDRVEGSLQSDSRLDGIIPGAN